MQIDTIKLKNYRQFKGEHTLDLETENGKNINIITAEGGSGKSNLLDTISFCLSGEDPTNEFDRIVNMEKIFHLEEGEDVDGYVEVHVGNQQPEYRFRREFRTFKREDENENFTTELLSQQKVDGEWRHQTNTSHILEKILPDALHEYCLVDGNSVDLLFAGDHLTEALESIIDSNSTSRRDIIKTIKEKVENRFNEIIDREHRYEMDIGDNPVRVFDESGTDIFESLSEGMKQVLALCLISSFSSVHEANVPVVIESPISSLDLKKRKRWAELLAQHFEATQLTLLISPTKYTSEVKDLLQPNVANKYEIQTTVQVLQKSLYQ